MKSILLVTLVALGFPVFAAQGEPVAVPSGVNHNAWNELLAKYVDDRGLVAYAKWKSDPADLKRLDDYLVQFAEAPSAPAAGDDQAASLVNLYNALTIHWILQNYPVNSIQALSDSFGAKRHRVGGKNISLYDIEHATLRPLIGYKAHAVLVCAARSCPPLQRFAYRSETFNGQIDTAYRAWLGRGDLNRFLPDEKKAEISSIFHWFKEDFDQAGGTKKVLAKYAPGTAGLPAGNDYEITYLPYNWGLNDQGAQGKDYSRGRMLRDRILDFITFWN